MLEELHIRDVGVIDEVVLPLGPGLTVVTGETGAGKTMVVSALELLLGGRADATRVRSGAKRALVEGRIVPVPVGAEEWVEDGDAELVVAREVRAGEEGTRSRARVGGRLAPASALSRLLGDVIEVHGQQDAHRLADPVVQRGLLDRSGGAPLARASARYRTAHAAWYEADAELSQLEASSRERARETDRLRAELAEIDVVEPRSGEDDELDRELRRMEHAESLRDAAASAGAAILDDGGARDTLGRAVSVLRGVTGIDPELTALGERCEALAADLQDVALELHHHGDTLELDPVRLEALRHRRVALRELVRKYGEDTAAVVRYADEARGRLAALDGGDERLVHLREEVTRLRGARDTAATDLRAARTAAGAALSTAVEGHLGDLAMGDATFSVAVEPTDPGPTGADRVTFLLAANVGEPALPLARAASGGERSRVALALRLSLAAADDAAVLVFDEVDAGVGGAVALAIGEKLARLAEGRQVLCVTHLAQLAAYADDHVVVTKRTAGGRTTAHLAQLRDDTDRLRELSRLLSGTPGSDRATEHAAELRARARNRLLAVSA